MTVFLDRLKERKESKDRLNTIRTDIFMLRADIIKIDRDISELERENEYINWLAGDDY